MNKSGLQPNFFFRVGRALPRTNINTVHRSFAVFERIREAFNERVPVYRYFTLYNNYHGITIYAFTQEGRHAGLPLQSKTAWVVRIFHVQGSCAVSVPTCRDRNDGRKSDKVRQSAIHITPA
jgi:hypothetical protein